jgi:hypothetical protein
LCKTGWEKHHRDFVEVVEGPEISNFSYYSSVHFSSKFGRKSWSKLPKPNWTRRWNANARPRRRLCHVGSPTYATIRACRGGPTTAGLCAAPLLMHPLPCGAPSRAGRTAPPFVRRTARGLPATRACRGRLPYPQH